jgi:hypothetical protein
MGLGVTRGGHGRDDQPVEEKLETMKRLATTQKGSQVIGRDLDIPAA